MKTTQLGQTDLQVSRLCLGCMTFGEPDRGRHAWTLPEASSRPLIQQALDAGINFFDTANSYSDGSSEEIVGRALKAFARREEIVVATKVYFPLSNLSQGLSRKNIMQSIDDSLKRLDMEYVDLLQIHRWDYETPLEETLEALNDVVKAGKARYIGASSMHAWQFAKAVYTQRQHGWAPFVSMQDQYNLIQREEEREMHPLCQAENIAVLPWSPLARGRLTRPWGEATARTASDEYGKTLYSATEENDAAIAQRVEAIAAQKGVSRAQVALAWLLHKPAVTAPIIGASRAEQLADLVKAVEVDLSAEEIAELETVYQPHPVVGFE
ncbi:aldo/keto reductase [Pantoea sp. ACRSH]|uniref:aldo/keto reductase n=1 Tax=unclassified Pantoea TaxID=2630326 RepID=UPI001EF5E5F4|nr:MULTISPECIES: aldo/keto reductase [unclassified Pantoea]MCG7365143.1 aldo/keto reductase [Pantoea sp. ACRSH]MCG7394981.1 aldo/keto reductase [Pantoea sp. ACRSC]